MSAKKVAERARRDHYPAPYAIIDLWKDFGGDVRNMPREHPGSTASLFRHPTTRNLIRLFKLQERLKAFGKEGAAKVEHLHVVGAGAMGGDIAAWAALKGIHVTLQDLAPERIAPAIKRAHELYKKRLKQPHLVQAAMDRLVPDVAGHGAARAGSRDRGHRRERRGEAQALRVPRAEDEARRDPRLQHVEHPAAGAHRRAEASRAARRAAFLQSGRADDAGRDRGRARRRRRT
jgi:hypothetical protein